MIGEQIKLERQKEEKQFNKQRDTFNNDNDTLTKLTGLQEKDNAFKTTTKTQVDALTTKIATYRESINKEKDADKKQTL